MKVYVLIAILFMLGALLLSRPSSHTTLIRSDHLEYSDNSVLENALEKDKKPVTAKDISDLRMMLQSYGYSSNIPVAEYDHFYDLLGLATIANILEADPYCHRVAHSLGRVIYAKSSGNLSIALQQAGNICAGGAFHGVLMEAFTAYKNEQGDDMSDSDVARFAVDFCKKSEVKRVVLGDCLHGVGHALAYLADYDLDRGLSWCSSFESVGSRYY